MSRLRVYVCLREVKDMNVFAASVCRTSLADYALEHIKDVEKIRSCFWEYSEFSDRSIGYLDLRVILLILRGIR